MAAEDPVEVARAYFTAINETRLDDLAAVFAEKARLSFPMLDPIEGRGAIRDFYQGVLEFYPERRDEVTRYFVSEGGDVAAEIHFEGKTANGRPVIFDAVDLFTVAHGLIQELKIFYDSAKVMQMVGELPK
jgi:ketosteroid isomerase-like protein